MSTERPGLPIPFTKEQLDQIAKGLPVAAAGIPPTSVADCTRNGGHGGTDGKRVYYPSGPKLGPLLAEKRICEICGIVGV